MTTKSDQSSSSSPEPQDSHSYVMLRKMKLEDDEPVENILSRLAANLSGLSIKAIVQLRLIRAEEAPGKKTYTLQLTPAGAALRSQSQVAPTLTVITTAKTFFHMMEGTYSPVQAYLDGRLHLHGDVGVAKQMALHLARTGDTVNVCPMLDAEQWQSFGNGLGALTVSGFNFTPGGLADLHYDWGGGTYRKMALADESGRFTVTESNLPCGDIPGKPGVGVIVSAFDQVSGQSLITGPVSYATPC